MIDLEFYIAELNYSNPWHHSERVCHVIPSTLKEAFFCTQYLEGLMISNCILCYTVPVGNYLESCSKTFCWWFICSIFIFFFSLLKCPVHPLMKQVEVNDNFLNKPHHALTLWLIAEDTMLKLVCQRAQVKDGHSIMVWIITSIWHKAYVEIFIPRYVFWEESCFPRAIMFKSGFQVFFVTWAVLKPGDI